MDCITLEDEYFREITESLLEIELEAGHSQKQGPAPLAALVGHFNRVVIFDSFAHIPPVIDTSNQTNIAWYIDAVLPVELIACQIDRLREHKSVSIRFFWKSQESTEGLILNLKKIGHHLGDLPRMLLIEDVPESINKGLEKSSFTIHDRKKRPEKNLSNVKLTPNVCGSCNLVFNMKIDKEGKVLVCPFSNGNERYQIGLDENGGVNFDSVLEQHFFSLTIGPLRTLMALFHAEQNTLRKKLSREDYETLEFMHGQIEEEFHNPLWPEISIDTSCSDRMRKAGETGGKMHVRSICDLCSLMNRYDLSDEIARVFSAGDMQTMWSVYKLSSKQDHTGEQQCPMGC